MDLPKLEPQETSPSAIVARARRLSRYADALLRAQPGLEEELRQQLGSPFPPPAMAAYLDRQDIASPEALGTALRRLRQRVMLRVVTRDLGGLADLAEVMRTVSALADLTVRRACDAHHAWLAERHGEPVGRDSGAPQRLIVVGMGKLGGYELNVSSDIDLVFVYPEDGDTGGARPVSNHEFFTRLGQRVIGALHEPTPEGIVFRVDMRLRPFGDSGPLVSSFASLENYFITQGREWERYAWIKGRPLCGERADELERLTRPFVFRKYLDFGAYGSMRELHAQIRTEVRRRELSDNIKLGPGGIREIEFIAQVFQLIRGGNVPQLRDRSTVTILERLGSLGHLPADTVAELQRAYAFLRNLEHRLQYLDDRQTQMLPQADDERALIAEAMGYAGWNALSGALESERRQVTHHFESVFTGPQTPSGDGGLEMLWREEPDLDLACERLGDLGYSRPKAICERIKAFRTGPRYRGLPRPSQKALDALVPATVAAAARQSDPDATLDALLTLLETISRRAAYLALLQEYPQALDRVAKLASASRWACDYLTRHPLVLDELLDTRELHSAPDWEAAAGELRHLLADAEGDTERQMDVLRHFQHAKLFQLLAKDLEGLLPLETLSDHLTALADLILEQVVAACWRDLRTRHRETPKFAIIGYGKLGGKELGYASDLDIIFLYDDDDPRAPEAYAKLAQRINTWLTSYTAAGLLYDTDLRLRPDGAGGLLVSPVAAFREYQRTKAWVWEHQAITRGRFAAGDRDVGAAFEEIRREVLCLPRDLETLKHEVVQMRQKMLDAHPNKSELFDIKHDRGGIIDVEFVVQYLVLGHAHRHPGLTGNIGNLALLKLAATLGLVPEDLAERARAAYREFRRLQHRLRLSGAQYARVPPESVEAHAAAVRELWTTVLGGA
ncbi:MAG: bifunctional [glutamate--ammonia ligase]-adenylyl-L-tyrosine phosphorylase/[glutamate--ammonia-ligase] adenylyltransferase [Pseudomonadota bacterium]